MKNNMSPKLRDLARTNLIYDFTCKTGECIHLPQQQVRYSGLTTCTLSRRLSFHLQKGAIRTHYEQCHGRNITREEIVDMTKARYYERDFRRLEILEALIIRCEDPEINKQDTGKCRVLKLYGTVMQSTIYMIWSDNAWWINFHVSSWMVYITLSGVSVEERLCAGNSDLNKIKIDILDFSITFCT